MTFIKKLSTDQSLDSLYLLKNEIEKSSSSDKRSLSELIKKIYEIQKKNSFDFSSSANLGELRDFAWSKINSHYATYIFLKKFINFYLESQNQSHLVILSKKMQEAINHDNSSLVHAILCVLKESDPPIPFEALSPPEGSTVPFLISAILQNKCNCILKLIEQGWPTNESDPTTGFNGLHAAADQGKYSLLETLLKRDFDPNHRDKAGNTPLHILSRRNDIPLSTFFTFKDSSINLNTFNTIGYTPLMIACYYNNAKTTGYLLNIGANPNVTHPIDLVTPLHISCYRGFYEIAEQLLEKGALVDAEAVGGITPLHSTSSYADCRLIDLLLKNQASVNRQDSDGRTPLHHLLKISRIQKISQEEKRFYEDIPNSLSLLLSNHANPNIQNNEKRTPLHEASTLPNSEGEKLLNMVSRCFELLLKHGAKSNVQAENKNYPFDELIESGDRYVELVSQKYPSYYPYNLSSEEFPSHLLRNSIPQRIRWLKGATEEQKIAFLQNHELEFSNKFLEDWEKKKSKIDSEEELLKSSNPLKMGVTQAKLTLSRLEGALRMRSNHGKFKELIETKVAAAREKLELINQEFDEMKEHFTKEEPFVLTCPISGEKITDPVVEPGVNQIYQRESLVNWVNTHHFSPLSGKPLTVEEIRSATLEEMEGHVASLKAPKNPRKRKDIDEVQDTFSKRFKEDDGEIYTNRRK